MRARIIHAGRAGCSVPSFLPHPLPAYSRHFLRGPSSETARKRLLRRLRDELKEHLRGSLSILRDLLLCDFSPIMFVTNVLDITREQALFFGKRFSMQVSFKPLVPQISNINVVQCKFADQGKLIKAVKMSRLR